MSHKIINESTFWCPKCLRHKKIEFRSMMKAHRLFVCIPCKTAVEALMKARRKKV